MVKVSPPHPYCLQPIVPLLGDHSVAAEELAGRFAVGLITHSTADLSSQSGHFGVSYNESLRLVSLINDLNHSCCFRRTEVATSVQNTEEIYSKFTC